MFSVLCNGRLLCLSPTYRGAERYIKLCRKRDKEFKYNYEIIQEVLEV